MNALAERVWWRPSLLATFAAGMVLLVSGLRAGTAWIEQGTLLHELAAPVPGAPPWRTTLPGLDPTVTHLLELAVTVTAPSDRDATVTARPELRVYGPGGQRIDQVLEPAGPAATVTARRETQIVCRWWLRPLEAGDHDLEVVKLELSQPELKPRAWRVRVARDVPASPAGRGPIAAGFILAALAFGLYMATLRPREVVNAGASSRG